MEGKAGARGQRNPPGQWEELTFPLCGGGVGGGVGGVGEGSGRAWALLCPQPSLTQPTHQDTLPYTLSSEVSCIP